MNVFIVGASGYIGNAVALEFLNNGHDVVGLCNSDISEKQLKSQNIKAVKGDMADSSSWKQYAEKADVIIHAAHLRPGMRLSSSWLRRSQELRDKCLLSLVNIARSNPGIKAIIYTSGMIAHGNHGEKIIDESTLPTASALGNYHREGERIMNEAANTGLPAMSIRPGMVYGNGGTFKKFFLDVAAKGKYQFPGDGENYIPFIHIHDLAKAYVAAVDVASTNRLINVVDDQPIKMSEMAASLLNCFGGGKHSSVPSWLVSLFAGRALSEMLVGSYRVKNEHARKVLDWEPQYGSFRTGISHVVADYQR
jgi:nucleoside-diphosphate-sugar epimerase